MKGISEEIAVIMLLAASLGVAGGLYLFVNGLYAHNTVTAELIDSYCVNNTAYFVVRNGGTEALARNSFVCKESDSGCAGSCVVDNIFPAGSAGYVKISGCSTGTHVFDLTGATNGLHMVVYCA